jgi:hypothetical protein
MPRRKTEEQFSNSQESPDIETEEMFGLPEDFPEMEPDPAPKRASMRAASSTRTKVTVAARKEVTKELTGLAEMLAGIWALRDPYCGEVAQDHAGHIAECWADWVCDHPTWVAQITEAGKSAKLFRAIYSTTPVAMAVYAHHVAHSVEQDGAGGDGLVYPDGIPQP